LSPGFFSPDAAEDAFYRAFAALDPAAMRRVWSADDTVTCIHPGGPLLQGLQAVLQSWSEIFAGSQPPRLSWERLSAVESDDLAVHVTAEQIQSGDPESARGARVVATNVFRRGPAGWLLVQHHASLPMIRQTRTQRASSLH
jgi:ketosteroid isomerase-like protein